MDEVIYENSRAPVTWSCNWTAASLKSVFPAININRSGTRREELLTAEDELQRIWILQAAASDGRDRRHRVPARQAQDTKTNDEFFMSMKRK